MSSEDPTKRYRAVAAIVLVSNQADQVDSCRRCAKELEAYFEHCVLDDAANVVATWRPFALVVDEDVLQSAPAKVEKVVEESRATLVVMARSADSRDPETSLMPKLRHTFNQYFA